MEVLDTIMEMGSQFRKKRCTDLLRYQVRTDVVQEEFGIFFSVDWAYVIDEKIMCGRRQVAHAFWKTQSRHKKRWVVSVIFDVDYGYDSVISEE